MPASSSTPASNAGQRGDLTDSAALRIATFRLSRRLRSHRAVPTMSNSQFAVLAALYKDHGLNLSQLAERERVSAPSMNRTVNALQEAGYVIRTADATDGRKQIISMTALGEEVVAETIRRRDAWLDLALADLADDERDIITRASTIMMKVAER